MSAERIGPPNSTDPYGLWVDVVRGMRARWHLQPSAVEPAVRFPALLGLPHLMGIDGASASSSGSVVDCTACFAPW